MPREVWSFRERKCDVITVTPPRRSIRIECEGVEAFVFKLSSEVEIVGWWWGEGGWQTASHSNTRPGVWDDWPTRAME